MNRALADASPAALVSRHVYVAAASSWVVAATDSRLNDSAISMRYLSVCWISVPPTSHVARGVGRPLNSARNSPVSPRSTCTHSKQQVYSSSRGCRTATGTRMPHGITRCYLPPGRRDIPALNPAEAGTRLSDPGGMQGWVDHTPTRGWRRWKRKYWKTQARKRQVRSSAFRQHWKTHVRKTQVRKTQVRICNGGKRNCSNRKSILKSLRFSSLAFSVDKLSAGLAFSTPAHSYWPFPYLRFPPLHIRTYVFRTCIFHPPVLSFSVLAFLVAPPPTQLCL